MSQDQDWTLFRETMGDVTPLVSDKVDPDPGEKPPPRRRAPPPTWRERVDQEPLQVVPFGAALSWHAAGTDRHALRLLRRGQLEMQSEVDLHGLGFHDAKLVLADFIDYCTSKGLVCALIVHGKGYRSVENRPQLKSLVNHMLRLHPEVAAFCSALPRQGGTGAVYVLFRPRPSGD